MRDEQVFALPLAPVVRIIIAADRLRTRGAEPHRALAIVLREGDVGELPPRIEAAAREIWAVAIGSDGSGPGGVAVLEGLFRILACAEALCSLGVEPHDAIDVLRWVDTPSALDRLAREAWASAVSSGAVVRASWSVAAAPGESGPGSAAVIDAFARILDLAERLHANGVKPRAVIDVLRWIAMPPGLATAVRAAWAFAAGFEEEGSDDHERRDAGA